MLISALAGLTLAMSTLVDAQSTWREQNISHYTVTFQRGCFCEVQTLARTRLTVNDGKITSAVYAESLRKGKRIDGEVVWDEVVADTQVDQQYRSHLHTIDGVFAELHKYLAMDEASVEAAFHPTFGYPTHVRIDPYPGLVDDKISYELADLVPGSESIAQAYIAALIRTWQEDATADDVAHLIALMSEIAVYEHPRIGMKIEGRDKIADGMQTFLGASRRPKVSALEIIEGPGVRAIGFNLSLDVGKPGEWQSIERRQVIILSVSDGHITRITDHW